MDPVSREHSGKAPLLFELKSNSLDDGPGIRTVVFFKGCPLDCVWCHNPESKRVSVELSHDRGRCIGCGHCVEVCPEGAITLEGAVTIQRHRCTLCMSCVDGCPSGAMGRVGFAMSPGEVVRTVMRDKPFFDNSGGGVTFSGGEPTMHLDYAAELAGLLQAQGIHVLLETCGLFPHGRFSELLLPHLNAVYFDLKLFEDSAHRAYCGASNRPILENLGRLADAAGHSKLTLLARTPLVPGITDTDRNLLGIAGFLRQCGITKAALLPYNPLWHDKGRSIGIEPHSLLLDAQKGFMSPTHVEHCRELFRSMGIDV
ncbi:MAG TPA: glycyl-radical enzyme activating protein [Deltaproteobacteria bacterium]|nr:glycyl-radical enzyme activating protein [Deltaproteobacteria bacterium]